MIQYSLLGHKGRCFDVRYDKTYEYLLSSCEDGTAKLWNLNKRKVVATLTHSTTSEVLRSCYLATADNTESYYDICTCGADGTAVVWTYDSNDMKYKKRNVLQHDEEEQIYACEALDNNKLLTASNNKLLLWDLNHSHGSVCQQQYMFNDSSGVAFGGDRNPDNTTFIFEAKVNPQQKHIVAVALSNGNIGLRDLRLSDSSPVCFGIHIPNHPSVHTTSLSWDPAGTSLTVALGSGHIAIVDLRDTGNIKATAKAHSAPCYGCCYYTNSNNFITWSSNGCIKYWDSSKMNGSYNDNEDVSIASNEVKGYPIFSSTINMNDHTVAIAGGLSSSFLGTPIHVLSPI